MESIFQGHNGADLGEPTHALDLASAIQLLADQCRNVSLGLGRADESSSATVEMLATVDRVQSLLFQLEPASFVQHVASQVSIALRSNPNPHPNTTADTSDIP